MVANLPTETIAEVIYPECDGKPISDNTNQFRWIVTIKENLELLYANDPNVFIAGDLLWYPVQGNNSICQAPDVLVAIGRPKGDRGSYQQWQEADIAPQIVFEILSPSNRLGEMSRKLGFYDRCDNSPAKGRTVLAGASKVHKLEFLLHWLSNDQASTGRKRLSYRPLQNV
jgi:Uma2 family endonuclease